MTDPVMPGQVDEWRQALKRAYEQGCLDVHNNYREDRDPDFSEAAYDYADSVIAASPNQGHLPEDYYPDRFEDQNIETERGHLPEERGLVEEIARLIDDGPWRLPDHYEDADEAQEEVRFRARLVIARLASRRPSEGGER